MKKFPLILTLASSLLLAACGGDPVSSSPTPTPASSPDAPVSSESPSSGGGSQSSGHYYSLHSRSYGFRSDFFTTVTEGSKYELNSNYFAITLEAESGIVINNESTTLPAGGKLTVSMVKEDSYFASTDGTHTTHILFFSEVDPASLSIENATGAVDAEKANQVNLTFVERSITTFSVVTSVDVSLDRVNFVYAIRA